MRLAAAVATYCADVMSNDVIRTENESMRHKYLLVYRCKTKCRYVQISHYSLAISLCSTVANVNEQYSWATNPNTRKYKKAVLSQGNRGMQQ